jgi:hypothetical protein
MQDIPYHLITAIWSRSIPHSEYGLRGITGKNVVFDEVVDCLIANTASVNTAC